MRSTELWSFSKTTLMPGEEQEVFQGGRRSNQGTTATASCPHITSQPPSGETRQSDLNPFHFFLYSTPLEIYWFLSK